MRIFFHNRVLTMSLPIRHIIRQDAKTLEESFQQYTNILLKTSFIDHNLSSMYSLDNVSMNEIIMQQVSNVPINEHVFVKPSQEYKCSGIFNRNKIDDLIHEVSAIKDFKVNLELHNDTNEFFGYCNEKVDVVFSEREH